MTRAARVTELSESLRLYLADTLACDVKLLANLFESPRSSVVESETELYHVLFARSESVQLALYDLAQDGCRGRVGGCRSVLVGDEVAKVAVLLLADRCFERHGILRYLHDIAYTVGAHSHLLAYLIGGRLASELLKHLTGVTRHLMDRLDHMNGYTNGPCLIGYCAGYRLPYPPSGVGRELVALLIVELLDSLHKSEVALLDQIEEEHSLADVALRDADDESEVRLYELVFCLLVAVRHSPCELFFLFRVEQRDFSDLLEVHTHGVVDGKPLLLKDTLHALGRTEFFDLVFDLCHFRLGNIHRERNAVALKGVVELVCVEIVLVHSLLEIGK